MLTYRVLMVAWLNGCMVACVAVSRWVRIVDHQLSAQSPAPRAYGGLVVYKTDVYVFGGSMEDGVTDYKLWKCDIAAFMQGSSEGE